MSSQVGSDRFGAAAPKKRGRKKREPGVPAKHLVMPGDEVHYVAEIYARIQRGESAKVVADELGVHQSILSKKFAQAGLPKPNKVGRPRRDDAQTASAAE